MLDQCQYFTSDYSYQFLCHRIEKRIYPAHYKVKNRLINSFLGKIQIKPMPFEIVSITNMTNVSKHIAESEIIYENAKTIDDQEKTQVPPNELWEKAKQCCNLLENSKVEAQDLIRVSHLYDQILDILQPPKPRNVYFISPHNSDTEIKQKKLVYNPEALNNLIKRLRSGRVQSQTRSLFRSTQRMQTSSIGKQIQKTELNEQLSAQALNFLKQLKKKQLNK
ncbi:unnamed protein product [Paramecium primaurelia]|uniref:Uncharacterized protein n=2 Tax=Paramecium TaxID=5884 RepID=A0A8S1YDR0_9CILI|nr:unnamed protein product [Paramecium primaurelia]CAD8210977.1 unnamed protein product [Paramecium pentaurelia]